MLLDAGLEVADDLRPPGDARIDALIETAKREEEPP
jgi:hypothetical protein